MDTLVGFRGAFDSTSMVSTGMPRRFMNPGNLLNQTHALSESSSTSRFLIEFRVPTPIPRSNRNIREIPFLLLMAEILHQLI